MALNAENELSAPLRRFLASSPCPYATRTRIAAPAAWDDPTPRAERLDTVADALRGLVRHGADGVFAIEIQGAGVLSGVHDAGALVHAILAGLRRRDETEQEDVACGVEEPDWDFRFEEAAFFVSLFGPFYPASHSRSSGEPDRAFILLQPEGSFRRFGISARHPRRDAVSDAVHRRFRAHGQTYDVAFNKRSAKALRYVKPLATGDESVRWWEIPY